MLEVCASVGFNVREGEWVSTTVPNNKCSMFFRHCTIDSHKCTDAEYRRRSVSSYT